MANKKEETRKANMRKAKERQFEAETSKLFIYPLIAAGLLVLMLLLFFVPWADIYNSDIGGAENGISGWNCFAAGISGNYTGTEGAIGDSMAVPFYYYAQSYCESIAPVTVAAFFITLLSLALQAVAIFMKKPAMNVISVLVNLVVAVLVLVCFCIGLSMSGSQILPVFCNANPACSIRSFAIIPALCAFGATALSVIASVKLYKALTALNG